MEAGVPDPEGWPPLFDGHDQLAPQDRPSVASADAVPPANPGLEEGVPGPHRVPAPPEVQRLPGRAARVLVIHPTNVAVVGDERLGRLPNSLLVEDRPILEPLDRSPVASPAAFPPLAAVVGDAAGCAPKDEPPSFFLPGPPLRRAPGVPLQRLGNEALGVRTITPGPQAKTAQAGRDG